MGAVNAGDDFVLVTPEKVLQLLKGTISLFGGWAEIWNSFGLLEDII